MTPRKTVMEIAEIIATRLSEDMKKKIMENRKTDFYPADKYFISVIADLIRNRHDDSDFSECCMYMGITVEEGRSMMELEPEL